jgi:hypothetical protein
LPKSTNKEEVKSKEIEMVQVPETMKIAFRLPEGDILDERELLVWIANEILLLKRKLA